MCLPGLALCHGISPGWGRTRRWRISSQATRIIARMIPEGTLPEMMGSMFDEMLGPMMELTGGASAQTIAEGI